jgi:hypothetical protein
MVQPVGGGDAYRCQSRVQDDDPSCIHAVKSQPRTQPDLQFLQRQPVTVSRYGWQRLCLLGGTGDRAEQTLSAGGRASGTHAGSLEKIPARAENQMQAALQKVAAAKGLSKDMQEVVVRALG